MKFFKIFPCVVALSLLSGCISFNKKSDSVIFHQLSAPAVVSNKSELTLFIPKANIPTALRRPTVVIIDESGPIQADDSQRWITSLERAVSETIGRNLTQKTGYSFSLQAPSETHLKLLIDVDAMFITADSTVLQLHYHFEDERGKIIGQGQGQWKTKRADQAMDYVKAQSLNLASAAADIAQELTRTTDTLQKSPR